VSRIQILGFDNLNKVAMTKSIQTYLSLNLAESKAITDQLLENGKVELEVDCNSKIKSLVQSLKLANANVKIVE